MKKKLRQAVCVLAVLYAATLAFSVLTSCSSTRHVPEGKMLLDDVKIKVEDKENATFKTKDLANYLRQNPNHKVLGGLKLQLGFYNLSGKDSTSRFNRWLQRVGSPPVIYDSTLTAASVNQLRTALINKGYMKAQVASSVDARPEKKKASVTYNVTLGLPYYVSSMQYDIPNDTLRNIILADTASFPIHTGSIFDHNQLNSERNLITEQLREHGYYAFSRDYISFTADTAAQSRAVDLTLNLSLPTSQSSPIAAQASHKQFYLRSVTFVTNYDPITMQDGHYFATDTTIYNNLKILYDNKLYLRRRVLDECCFLVPGNVYKPSDVNRTYQALGRLNILKFVNIDMRPAGDFDGKSWLDAYVLLTRDKSQSISFSLEGTNSEGDLGFEVGTNYQHRNLMRGSETLDAKFKVSYESLSGNLNGLINDNYSEYSGEVGIRYPKFKAPFLSKDFKQKIMASTELSTSFNYQERPEFTRIIAGAGWKYIWSAVRAKRRHTFNLIEFNYVYLPKSKTNFLDSISNPLLRYSYEDHLIMRMGYSFSYTNRKQNNPLLTTMQGNVYTVRASGEIAGNLLYGISKATGQHRSADEAYKVFGIRYSQYAKVEGSYSLTHFFDERNSLAVHAELGVAVPYGNSTILPFEKRFYQGGANGVRGWGVRTLGPGSYDASNSQNRFIYQCGDIRLGANIEYRFKLFWVLESALFVDAGNIWTIRDYDDQPGGVFKLNKFYKQIATAYGVGLRMNFNYFLVRLDMGMKAHNPAKHEERWPLTHPHFSRDAEFHFSVGYPF